MPTVTRHKQALAAPRQRRTKLERFATWGALITHRVAACRARSLARGCYVGDDTATLRAQLTAALEAQHHACALCSRHMTLVRGSPATASVDRIRAEACSYLGNARWTCWGCNSKGSACFGRHAGAAAATGLCHTYPDSPFRTLTATDAPVLMEAEVRRRASPAGRAAAAAWSVRRAAAEATHEAALIRV